VTNPEIIVCKDVDELNRKAAAQFISLAKDAIARSGRFAVALSGGSTPKALYSLLASPEYRNLIDWSRLHLFWGDERCVPPDHPESNFRMVRESLLSQIRLPTENIHRMAGEKDPAAAAVDYERELRVFFQPAENAVPRFDLILLGLGEDGHTASLFPGSAAVNERQRWVATVFVERLKAHRLTLTLPLINSAAKVSFLIAGENKSAVVKDLLGTDSDLFDYPAGQVKLLHGQLTWFITRDAARGIPVPKT
jgi:6-phosphogluconolactonase